MNALVSRRRLLTAGLCAAAAAGAAGLLGRLPSPGSGFAVLSAGEARIVEAVAAVLFPPGHFPVTGGDGGTAPAVDRYMQDFMDPAAVGPFRYLLRALNLGTLVSRGLPFFSLQADEAADVLAVWSSEDPAPRRLVQDSFRVVVGGAFLRRPEVLTALGWRLGCGT